MALTEQPSNAAPQDSAESSLIREGASRPLAVWLLIIWVVASDIIIVTALVRSLRPAFSHWGENSSIGFLAISLVVRLGIIALLLVLVHGVYRRKPWSRWVGLFAIVGLAAIVFSRPDTAVYANEAERAGGFVGRLIIIPLLLAWWAYAFALSIKSKRYFAKSPPVPR